MSTLRRLAGWLTVASLVAIVTLSVASHLAPAFGWQLVAIRGGSMEPSIPRGAAIAVHPVAIEEIEAGDVVTYRSDGGVLITHRVVGTELDGADRRLALQGDANPTADPATVSGSQLVGRVGLSLPLVGFVLAALGTPGGVLAALAWMAMLVLVGMALEDDGPRRTAGAVPAGEAPA